MQQVLWMKHKLVRGFDANVGNAQTRKSRGPFTEDVING